MGLSKGTVRHVSRTFLNSLKFPSSNFSYFHFSECFNILSRNWRLTLSSIPDKQEKTLSEIVDLLYEKKVLKKYQHKKEKMSEIENFVEASIKDYH